MQIYQLVKKYDISKTLFITYFTFLALILYFTLKLFFGQKGLLEMIELQDKMANKDLAKKELINEIKGTKIRVDSMRDESLDLDLLDEQARKKLGLAGQKEIVIYKDNIQKK